MTTLAYRGWFRAPRSSMSFTLMTPKTLQTQSPTQLPHCYSLHPQQQSKRPQLLRVHSVGPASVLGRVLEIHASDDMQLTRASFNRDLKLAFHSLYFCCSTGVMSAKTHVRSPFRCPAFSMDLNLVTSLTLPYASRYRSCLGSPYSIKHTPALAPMLIGRAQASDVGGCLEVHLPDSTPC